jgi:hypothetical protein
VAGECALAGPDLEHGVVGTGSERLDDAPLLIGIDQEVLAERLLRAVAGFIPARAARCGRRPACRWMSRQCAEDVIEDALERLVAAWQHVLDQAGLAGAGAAVG